VTAAEGFSGFSNPAVITVIAMFILSSGLIRTGVADYAGRRSSPGSAAAGRSG
jgi:di/tricarboxylate transporter